jgi:hypothetical protein
MKIDTKSLLCGILMGVSVILCIGADDSPSSALCGRYQIVTVNGAGMQPNALILDTTTGKVWGADLSRIWKNDSNFFEPKK